MKANGGSLVLVPRSEHSDVHLTFDAVHDIKEIKAERPFKLTLASHPGKALVITESGGAPILCVHTREFITLGEAADALEVIAVESRGALNGSDGMYLAKKNDPGETTLSRPNSIIYPCYAIPPSTSAP